MYRSEVDSGPYVISCFVDMNGVERLLPELDVVFEFFPYYVQDMSYDRHSAINRRGLYPGLLGPEIDMVKVKQDSEY